MTLVVKLVVCTLVCVLSSESLMTQENIKTLNFVTTVHNHVHGNRASVPVRNYNVLMEVFDGNLLRFFFIKF